MIYLDTFENFLNESKLSKFIHKVKKAKQFATKVHGGVYRKGLNEKGEKIPYIVHPDSVAKIVHSVKNSKRIADLIAASYLHDTVQDTDVTFEDIEKEFGELVMNIVKELTSNKEKLEISGKEEYLIDKMINMSSWALVIKLADRYHNLSDFEAIVKSGDKKRLKWAKSYAKQTQNIVDELEWYRKLSNPQKALVDMIKERLKIIL